MLFVFLLNVLGYYGIFVGIQLSFERELKNNLDENNYSTSKEITIHVPLSVPYVADAQEFSRVDGEFEYQGEVYRLVKQRYASDTLFIVCIKDDTSKEIKQALTDYVKTFTDKPSSEKGQSKTFQNLIKDYISLNISVNTTSTGWSHKISYGDSYTHYESFALALSSPPPQA